MSVLVIPTRTDLDNYSLEVELEGVAFVLSLAWNYRDESWFLSVATTDGTPIASGIKVVCNTSLLATCSNPDRPPGSLYAWDTSGAGTDPGLDELGERVTLLYQEATA